MKIFRNNVFETNSSSTHSLTINDGVDYDQIVVPDSDGVYKMDLLDAEFGWETCNYQDCETKLKYIYLYIRDWCGPYKTWKGKEFTCDREKHLNKLMVLLKEHCDIQNILIPTGNSLLGSTMDVEYKEPFYGVEEYENASDECLRENKKFPYEEYRFDAFGYIDHQSVECRRLDYLFEDVDKLKAFLFSSKSILHTDNDNY